MYRFAFEDRRVAYSELEGFQKTGLVGTTWPGYIHVSKEDQVTGEDLKTLFYPSKIIGVGPDGSPWSQEVTKDGKVTFRSESLGDGGISAGVGRKVTRFGFSSKSTRLAWRTVSLPSRIQAARPSEKTSMSPSVTFR